MGGNGGLDTEHGVCVAFLGTEMIYEGMMGHVEERGGVCGLSFLM
jgi:hypothetical protein